jgi:hypothetical protein
MHPEVEGELASNRGERWPWEGHVHPLAELDDEVLLDLVRRDRVLWARAQYDPQGATLQAIEDRLFFRRNEPRLGEPLYRTPAQAEQDQRNMYCGRGTGHLGTGLYFFGTLHAAADLNTFPESPDRIRELVSDVWAVDMEHIPDARIYMSDAEATGRAHRFAKAMLCWPPERRSAKVAYAAVRAAQEALEAAQALLDLDEDDDEAFYGVEDAEQSLREASRSARSALVTAERTAEYLDTHRLRRVQPNGDFLDDLIDLIDETKDEPQRHGPRGALPTRRSEPVLQLRAVPEPAPDVATAIERYVEDAQGRRFPGYHPMTYYMRELGYDAVLHTGWDEFNSGDIGNLWYPVTTTAER